MLCQYLGFDKTDANDINTGQFGSGLLIATGDLICNNTQASGISCCTHLVPSTTTSNVRISKVRCEYGIHIFALHYTQHIFAIIWYRFSSPGKCHCIYIGADFLSLFSL